MHLSEIRFRSKAHRRGGQGSYDQKNRIGHAKESLVNGIKKERVLFDQSRPESKEKIQRSNLQDHSHR